MAKRKNPTAGYKPDFDQPIYKRIADFLHWYAIKQPMRFATWRELARAISPKGVTEDTIRCYKRNIYRARKHLNETYRQEVVVSLGVGVRATADDEDIVTNGLLPKTKRVIASLDALRKSAK